MRVGLPYTAADDEYTRRVTFALSIALMSRNVFSTLLRKYLSGCSTDSLTARYAAK